MVGKWLARNEFKNRYNDESKKSIYPNSMLLRFQPETAKR